MERKRPREEQENSNNNNNIGGSNHVAITCTLPPCDEKFQNYNEYEHHIITFHDNVCTTCHRNFPNDHYLNLHIDEYHNPFIQISHERGNAVYRCLVANCPDMFVSSSEREQHLIRAHSYPSDFQFDIINTGI
ncbi:uncharacterized protein SPAPADRAFT_143393 [Spathaspora passalidarum NRRL Y-27907]|uniref:C2H2-type domain-containing protein n=1 Tax=Spathaspora passalidarum (strain NRRL Y-27907 / 11-Y1) TaxID=619300 RepID=G3ATX4_SPAPN|nr:uncharacterized protein SPAPADRAFT_143393 [Spathaspora passalidarum NRRL Y-27907]EGW30350.1 hypothetical protein SPAPADRAFT_143393 [Spathaspora passalidarum NRRL Y-27907]